MVVWITGITASGKTFLGKSLMSGLIENGYVNIIHLDGDELRKRSGWVQGHSLKDRFKIIELLIDLIIEEQNMGKIVIVSTVSHIKNMRELAREKIHGFHEVYLNCSSEKCAERDYKGFYERAEQNTDSDEIFPGVTEEYQVSENPELILNTGEEDSTKSSEKLLSYTLIELRKSQLK
tara:strand:+ start:5950 stop:6483 length:534 start_codon:yes stop_codon:yes gene_type:complete